MFRKGIALFLSVSCVFLSGCNYMGTNIEALVRPPSLSHQQEEIYDALKLTLQPENENVLNLVSPENGSDRSAVIIHNIDSEPTDEAIAFYNTSAQSTLGDVGLRICVLDQIDEQWRVVWDIPGEGSDVDKVLFLTDHATNHEYIIIGFIPKEDEQQRTYCIYDYRSGVLQQCATGEYQMLELFDIDADGQDEIITVSYEEDKSSTQDFATMATVTRIENGEFVNGPSTVMAGKAISYNSVTKDTTSFNVPALIIDEQVSKSTYATEILVGNHGGLQNLIYRQGGDLYDKTVRAQIPISYDINHDGIIEIPQTEFFPGYSADSESPLYLSKWYQLKNGHLSFVTDAYVNYSRGYGLLLPTSWEGRVTATNLLENDELKFFVYHGDLDDESEPVLSIKTDTLNNISTAGIPDGYFQVGEIGQLVYLARIYPVSDPALALTPEQVQNQFVEMYITVE